MSVIFEARDIPEDLVEFFEPVIGKRDVWNIATRPFHEAHFATFPEEIPMLCILAGSRPGDVVLDPFAGASTTGLVCKKLARAFVGIELNEAYVKMGQRRIDSVSPLFDSFEERPDGAVQSLLDAPSDAPLASTPEDSQEPSE